MTANPQLELSTPHVRRSERLWLAAAIFAMVLGVAGLGAFVFGLGGGMSQTASTSPALTPDIVRTQ